MNFELSPYKSSPCRIAYQHGHIKVSDKVLGEGGTGVVYRAFSTHTDSPFAVKTVFEEHFAQKEVAGLQLEIPHATRYRADFKRDDEYHVVMDEVIGKTTKDVRLSLAEISAIASQQFEVLEDLEDKGLINFDIKPENMIWNRVSKTLTIIDLAALHSIDELGEDNPGVTIEYLPPEAILAKELDTSYNIWSTGCLLFELIVGEKLFEQLPADPEESDFIFFQIVEQIGRPTKEYVDTCERGYLLFDEELKMKPRWPLPVKEHWMVRLKNGLLSKGATDEQIEQWQKLLSSMLCYENRIEVHELRNNPVCPVEIRVGLLFDRMNKCTLEITRASCDEKSPDLTIDLRREKTTCLHLPKDPQDEYTILVKNSSKEKSARLCLKDGEKLDLFPLQQEIETRKKLNFTTE